MISSDLLPMQASIHPVMSALLYFSGAGDRLQIAGILARFRGIYPAFPAWLTRNERVGFEGDNRGLPWKCTV